MTLPPHITVIGAGSTSSGENTLSAQLGSKILEGSILYLGIRMHKRWIQ